MLPETSHPPPSSSCSVEDLCPTNQHLHHRNHPRDVDSRLSRVSTTAHTAFSTSPQLLTPTLSHTAPDNPRAVLFRTPLLAPAHQSVWRPAQSHPLPKASSPASSSSAAGAAALSPFPTSSCLFVHRNHHHMHHLHRPRPPLVPQPRPIGPSSVPASSSALGHSQPFLTSQASSVRMQKTPLPSNTNSTITSIASDINDRTQEHAIDDELQNLGQGLSSVSLTASDSDRPPPCPPSPTVALSVDGDDNDNDEAAETTDARGPARDNIPPPIVHTDAPRRVNAGPSHALDHPAQPVTAVSLAEPDILRPPPVLRKPPQRPRHPEPSSVRPQSAGPGLVPSDLSPSQAARPFSKHSPWPHYTRNGSLKDPPLPQIPPDLASHTPAGRGDASAASVVEHRPVETTSSFDFANDVGISDALSDWNAQDLSTTSDVTSARKPSLRERADAVLSSITESVRMSRRDRVQSVFPVEEIAPSTEGGAYGALLAQGEENGVSVNRTTSSSGDCADHAAVDDADQTTSILEKEKKSAADGTERLWLEEYKTEDEEISEQLRLEGRSAEKRADMAFARELYRKCVMMNPGHGKAWQDLAKCEGRIRGGLRKSASILRKALEINPNNAYLWQSLGFLEFRMGQHDLARSTFLSGLECDPSHAPIYSTWARMEGNLGNHARARDLFEQGAAIDSTCGRLFYTWGVMEHSLGNVGRAHDLFQQGLDVDPDNVYIWQVLGTIAVEDEKFDRARECFERALAADENNVVVLDHWGRLEARLGNWHKSRELFAAGVENSPMDSRILHSWAVMEYQRKDFVRAQELMRRAVSITSRDAMLWVQFAKIELALGNVPRARALFKRASEVSPKDWTIWDSWSAMEYGQGNLREAEKLLERSFAIRFKARGDFTVLANRIPEDRMTD